MNNARKTAFFIFFISSLSLTVMAIPREGRSHETEPERIKIGDFFYTEHVLERMYERDLECPDISATIQYGEHYHVSRSKTLCIDPANQTAVYYNPKRNIVITAMREVTKSWISSHIGKQKLTRISPLFPATKTYPGELGIDTEVPSHKFKGKSASEVLNFLS